MDEFKLKPCPFCGAEAKYVQCKDEKHEWWADGHWFMEIEHDNDCFMWCMRWPHFGGWYDKEKGVYCPLSDTAIKYGEKWNRRADNG